MRKFYVGDLVRFKSELLNKEAGGMIYSLHANSCVIEMMVFDNMDAARVYDLNQRILVSYKNLEVVPSLNDF